MAKSLSGSSRSDFAGSYGRPEGRPLQRTNLSQRFRSTLTRFLPL